MRFLIFVLGTSAACKCFPKANPIVPSKYVTEAACHEACGIMRYFSDGSFDCDAHTMSSRLRKFSIWCSVFGRCSDCHCPSGCSNACSKPNALLGNEIEDDLAGDYGETCITKDSVNVNTVCRH